MLFHTWTFALFLAVVLPVLFALRHTRFWIPWLLVASYTFYGWWNPYYLILVFYSTLLDFILVAFMDHCPRERKSFEWRARLLRLHFDDAVMKLAFTPAASSERSAASVVPPLDVTRSRSSAGGSAEPCASAVAPARVASASALP